MTSIKRGAKMTEIIHKELSYRLVGCIFDVHNEVGPGVREECYQKAMEHRLRDGRIPFIAKPSTRHELIYRGQVVDIFEPDFVVAEQIILELKHQVEGFVPENESQVLNYLKFWNLDLGLLANFALDKAYCHRVPRQPPPPMFSENYDHIAGLIQPEHKPTLRAIRDGLFEIFQTIGLGYTATTYQKITLVELRWRQLSVATELVVEPIFMERRLPHSPISPFIVDGMVCVQIDAINDDVSARIDPHHANSPATDRHAIGNRRLLRPPPINHQGRAALTHSLPPFIRCQFNRQRMKRDSE